MNWMPSIITRADLVVAVYIQVVIISVLVGLIGGMATQVGGLRNLFKLTSEVASKRAYKTADKKCPPSNNLKI